jgi:hypothetical protein
MQPYEFGMRVGFQLEKRAGWADGHWLPSMGEAGSAISGALIGHGGITGTNHLDPTQRGIATDLLAYSNPLTGVVTGANDITRHLYNGRYLGALGSAGMTALSFIPGAGGMIGKGIQNGLTRTGMRVGNKLMANGMTSAGKSVVNTVGAAQHMANVGGRAMARPGVAGYTRAGTYLGVPAAGAAGEFMSGGSAPATPQMPQPQTRPQMPRPQTTFRPKPMGTF